MAKFDQGGGCPCGLYRECEPGCEHAPMPPAKPRIRVKAWRRPDEDLPPCETRGPDLLARP